MTREEQIRHEAGSLADFAISHGTSWKEYHSGFIDGAKWADEHPVQSSLPSNLDEAAENHMLSITTLAFDEMDVILSFKAGAKWMAEQGLVGDAEVCKLTDRAWVTPLDEKLFQNELYNKFNAGDDVVVQIRKK